MARLKVALAQFQEPIAPALFGHRGRGEGEGEGAGTESAGADFERSKLLFFTEANATTLSYISLTFIGPINLTCSRYLDRHVFRNYDFLAFFKIRIVLFSWQFLTFLDHLYLSNGVYQFLINFDGFLRFLFFGIQLMRRHLLTLKRF